MAEEKENSKVSCIGSITIQVDNMTVTAVQSENGMVRVSNHHLCLPIFLSHGKVHIHRKGKSTLIQSNFKLKVLYSWDDHVVIKLPAPLSRNNCGMCGNNNGDPQDDTLSPDGKQVWDIVEFGWSWKATSESGHCQDICDGDCGRCRWDQVHSTRKAETWCGKLSQHSGPFQSCHDTISPNIYVKNCIYDLCANEGHRNALCHSLRSMLMTARRRGSVLPTGGNSWNVLSLARPTAPTALVASPASLSATSLLCHPAVLLSPPVWTPACATRALSLMPTPESPLLNVAVSFRVSSMALARNFGVT
nr:IgGFc-binding protein-like isoform X2 [Zonotrichia albicollis]